jgi:hypothetical protein
MPSEVEQAPKSACSTDQRETAYNASNPAREVRVWGEEKLEFVREAANHN